MGPAGHLRQAGGNESFQAELISVDGRHIPASRDFDPATGQAEGSRACCCWTSVRPANCSSGFAAPRAGWRTWKTSPTPRGPIRRLPPARCNRRRTASTASPPGTRCRWPKRLYENGHITYMRTDSTTLASVAIEAARQLVASQYGKEYLPAVAAGLSNQGEERPGGPRGDSAGRPSLRFSRVAPRTAQPRRVQALRPDLEADGRQPDDRRPRPPRDDHHRGRRRRVSRPSARRSSFPAICGRTSKGPTIPSPTWPTARRCCRRLSVGETLQCVSLEPKSHTTQPPNRYSEAALTRALEEMGIGRPSTYASIIDTILAREYVFKLKRGNVLVPTWTAFAVSQLLEEPPARPGRLPVHGGDGRRTGRHQPRRDEPSRLPADVLFRQRASGAEAVAERQGERDRRPRRVPHLARQAAGRRGAGGRDFRARGPLRAVPGARRAAGEPARQAAARRTDAASGPGNARQGRHRATSRWAFAPTRTSRCSSRWAASGPTCSAARPTTTRSRKTPRCCKGMEPEHVDLETALEAVVAAAHAWASIRRPASRWWPTTAASAPM